MSARSFLQLFTLAAIWGASFMFVRVASPVLGAAWTAELRVGFAALFLALVALYLKKGLDVGRYWRHFLILGAFNSALPFLLYSYAGLTLSASLLSILNATTPIWGAVLLAIATRQMMTLKTVVGLCFGVAGVSILVGFDAVALEPGASLAIVAALGAAFCYAMSATYARNAPAIDSFSNAHGSMWGATLVLLPTLAFAPVPTEVPATEVVVSVLSLGILCSGIAYLLYFRLIRDLGPPSALTVTFLIPMFGVLWGHLFLDEVVGWHTLAGSLVVLIGTALVTGFSPLRLLKRKAAGAVPE